MGVEDEKKELKCYSPSAIMAIWIDNLGRQTGHDQEKILITCDYNKDHILEHIKISDPEGKVWEQHFRRRVK